MRNKELHIMLARKYKDKHYKKLEIRFCLYIIRLI
jgi:hypothetical protein